MKKSLVVFALLGLLSLSSAMADTYNCRISVFGNFLSASGATMNQAKVALRQQCDQTAQSPIFCEIKNMECLDMPAQAVLPRVYCEFEVDGKVYSVVGAGAELQSQVQQDVLNQCAQDQGSAAAVFCSQNQLKQELCLDLN
jgi:hypothetical protein